MPTERKTKSVEMLSKLLADCTIAIATDFTGMSVTSMTGLRRAVGQTGADYKVVKNNLLYLAGEDAGKPQVKNIVEGSTGIAFGFDEPSICANAVVDYIRSNRVQMNVRGAMMGDRILNAGEVEILADLPPKNVVISRFMGQLQAPVTSLLYVMNGPVSAFARTIQAIVDMKSKENA
jgi:large subunit ribosomal protein L10